MGGRTNNQALESMGRRGKNMKSYWQQEKINVVKDMRTTLKIITKLFIAAFFFSMLMLLILLISP